MLATDSRGFTRISARLGGAQSPNSSQSSFFFVTLCLRGELPSEWEPDRDRFRVIELVKVRDRDLLAGADGETQAFPYVEASGHQPRRQKNLLLANQFRASIRPHRDIGLQLGP